MGVAATVLLSADGLPTTNDAGANVPAKVNQLANFPLNFLRTGIYYYNEGKMYHRTLGGYWWSASCTDTTYAKYLHTTTNIANPQSSNYRGYGFALRCVNPASINNRQ